MSKRPGSWNEAGFTLAEMLIVVGVISVLMVTATAVMPGVFSQAKADGSTQLVIDTLRLARDRAIGERRNMDLVFVPPNRIQIVREEISGGTNKTVIDVYLEQGQQFAYFSGMVDTPDQFGRTNAPLAFGPIAGTSPTIMFTSEGTLVDASGDTINGTVFLATGPDRTSARAVTIFGATALLRSYKFNGKGWVE